MIAKNLVLPEVYTKQPTELRWLKALLPEILFLVLLGIWFFAPYWLHDLDPTAADIDQSHWFLVLLGLITFMLNLALCWWLLQHLWDQAGLPEIKNIFLKFNQFSSWQQLKFLLACFALLLLAAIGCLASIC